ncbi:MAG: alpha/beta hydrolase [Acidimicrobiia bacterium]|nr:MAG: alpha/beta hydrolase [Acidimicrobiia bacterium]
MTLARNLPHPVEARQRAAEQSVAARHADQSCRWRMRIATFLGAVAVLGGVIAWSQQRRLLYHPESSPGPPPSGWSEVMLATHDGLELTAWQNVDGTKAPLVVIFPGNSGNRADRIPLGAAVAARGFGVLLVEYRGYGGNPGHPSEAGLAEDAVAAARFVRSTAPGRPIVYYGESLGAAVAVGLTVNTPPAALILGSPFTSVIDVGRYHYPWAPSFLFRETYPSLRRIEAGALDGISVLVTAGSADTVTPVEQSRAVADASGAEWYEVPGVEHNDPAIRSATTLVDRFVEFIERALGDGA